MQVDIIENQKEILDKTFNIDSKQLPSIDDFYLYVNNYNYNIDKEDYFLEIYNFRIKYVVNSFPILTKELFETLSEYLKSFNGISELSCGSGWLTYWLRKYNILVDSCVDDFSWNNECQENKKFSYNKWVTKKDSISHVKETPEIELYILSWPYMDDVAYNIWNSMKENQYLLYIGEDISGCCANDKFFYEVQNKEIEKDFVLLNKNYITFESIYDKIIIFKK